MDLVKTPDFGFSRCPVRGTREASPAVAVPVSWTVNEKGEAETVYVHLGCLDLVLFRDPAGGERGAILIQFFQVEEGT